jgi:hypothetical protein
MAKARCDEKESQSRKEERDARGFDFLRISGIVGKEKAK